MGISIHEAWADGASAIIVGCGGVGGTVAARLVGLRRQVVAVTGNPDITAAIGANQLLARLPAGERRVPLEVVTRAQQLTRRDFDIALLAVPPNRLEEAARDVAPHLKRDGVLVPLANGLPEERLEAIFPGRVVGGIVAFGASMHAPGDVEQTSEGGFTVGRLDGNVDDAVHRVAMFLAPNDHDMITTNLRGARWSKLAINCAISSLGTVGGDRLGALMRHRFGRRLCLEIMTEVTQVALALGVNLEKISGTLDLEWLALDDDERMAPGSPSLLAKHTVLLAVGAKYRRLRSSMLAAIERGREPPIDFLNGEVTRRAPGLNVPVPVNEAVVAAIQQIAKKQRTPSLESLRRLFDETRPVLRSLKLAA